MNHPTRTEFLPHNPIRSAAEAVPPAEPLDIDQLAGEILSRDPGDAIVPELRGLELCLILASNRLRKGDGLGAIMALSGIQIDAQQAQREIRRRSQRRMS